MKEWLSRAVLVFVASLASAHAQTRDFEEYAAAPAVAPGRVEVVDYFMYSCAACLTSRSALENWARRLPRNVSYSRVAAQLGTPEQQRHMKMFYALESMGLAKNMEASIFNALHYDKLVLSTPEQQADFLEGRGVDRGAYVAALSAPPVLARMGEVDRRVHDLGLQDFPGITINHRYVVQATRRRSASEVMRIADYVIDRVRAGDFQALASGRVLTEAQLASRPKAPDRNTPSVAATPSTPTASPVVGVAPRPPAVAAAPSQPPASSQPPTPSRTPSAPGGIAMSTQYPGWPAGIEPGNLYIVTWFRTDIPRSNRTFLMSSRSRAEGMAVMQRSIAAEAKFYGEPTSKFGYTIEAECTGPNWGAVFYLGTLAGAACGARTPREAMIAAANKCADEARKIGRAAGCDYASIEIGHSAARPPVETPPLESPVSGGLIRFAALSATTKQTLAADGFFRTVDEQINAFGKECGYPNQRKTRACWISMRMLDCIHKVNNGSDGMVNQQQCVDTKLTAEGYVQ